MKAINQRQQRLLRQHPAEEKKLNKFLIAYHKRKAASLACLFLFLSCACWGFPSKSSSTVEEWQFDEPTQKAYELVLNLQLDEAHQLIPEPETAHQHYVLALAEALELLITEDGEKYTEYEGRFTNRLERRTKPNVPDDLFLQAEIRMHWTFVYLKFGHEFDAALNLRQAYLTIEELRNKFPKFKAINKTSGLLEVIIGSVPQKYNWVLSLLNMEGSTRTGLAELQAVRLSDSPLAFEACLIHALIQGFLLQQPAAASSEINALRVTYPHNRLALFLASALAMKNNQSEEALVMLDSLRLNSGGVPLYYADYLRGEIYLFKGEYLNSISSYRWFINHYNGQNGVKDAYYKIGMCYWLNGNTNDAVEIFKEAKSRGKEASEADKYAARSLAEEELPHVSLTKARYAIDGGYYERAKQILDSLASDDIPTQRDKVEYFYRKARLAHKLNDLDTAKSLYLRSIEVSGDEEWYYAPNACLQLGYIFWSENDNTLARSYFNKAMSYSKHEYKNSIDSKAKSAIAQIKRK
jgi:tetratricopeptide (TPR) repeat protein